MQKILVRLNQKLSRAWFHMSSQAHISHGFRVLLVAALMACLLDIGHSYLMRKSSPVLAALDLPQPQAFYPTLAAPDSLLAPAEADTVDLTPAPDSSQLALLPHPLQHFFQALIRQEEEGGTVRIGYFGDSVIEGDLVTQSFRHDLQQQLGGRGVGFVPIKSQTYGFRKSIWHRFSGDWQDFNLLTPQAPRHDYGISGEYFITRRAARSGRTWVRYKGADIYQNTQQFERVRLFYGQRKSRPKDTDDQYVVVTTDLFTDTLRLRDQALVNSILVSSSLTEEIKLDFKIPRDLPVYGLSFESQEGVFVDNFASRGNSGMNLIEIPEQTLAQFHQHLQYDLIVLQFGLNVISTHRKNFQHYEKGMERVVRHFQEHVPGADILLVGVSDKSTHYRGELQTDPSVPLIVSAQQRVAERTGVAFLNLYQSMGGRNSMIQWVKNDLARKDYTHPNRKGAERVGQIVQGYLLEELDTYRNGGQKQGQSDFAMQRVGPQ